jgi:hypothetical protein
MQIREVAAAGRMEEAEAEKEGETREGSRGQGGAARDGVEARRYGGEGAVPTRGEAVAIRCGGGLDPAPRWGRSGDAKGRRHLVLHLPLLLNRHLAAPHARTPLQPHWWSTNGRKGGGRRRGHRVRGRSG